MGSVNCPADAGALTTPTVWPVSTTATLPSGGVSPTVRSTGELGQSVPQGHTLNACEGGLARGHYLAVRGRFESMTGWFHLGFVALSVVRLACH